MRAVTHGDDGGVATADHQDVYQQFLQLEILVVRHQLQMLDEYVVALD